MAVDEKDHEIELQQANNRVSDEKLSRYEEIRNDAEKSYKSFRPIKCPALKGKEIHFTSEGFNHLIYRIPKQERNRRVQILRFELLTKARTLLEQIGLIQEYEEYYNQKKVWMNKTAEKKNVLVRDMGFVGIIKGYRIKVVVRRIGEGKFLFYSVIPAWTTRYYRDIKVVRNSKGNVAD